MSFSTYSPLILSTDSPSFYSPIFPRDISGAYISSAYDMPGAYIPYSTVSTITLPQLPQLPQLPRFPGATTILTAPVSPYVSFPLLPSLDLNRDPQLHKTMTKYFYFKALDKWLKREKNMLELLNYLRVTDRGVQTINKLEDFNPRNIDLDNQQVIDMKVKFIENNILSKDDIYNILKKYVRETGTNWYDLQNNSYFIKEIIKKFIKKRLEQLISYKMNRG